MKKIILNNGIEMPLVGFGTYQIVGNECEKIVAQAIENGYRLIDTAQAYGNEKFVGSGIKNCGLKREEIFLTTKIWFRNYEIDDCRKSLKASLEKLQTDYLDLVLLHWPFGNTYAAWRVLEDFYLSGTIKAIGVSNYMPSQLIDLIHFNKIIPAVNQVETNLFCQQKILAKYMEKYKVAHQAYAPFGQGKANEMFDGDEIKKIAEKYSKTPRQVALRFLAQKNISVIPKTVHVERMKENFSIFDFELTADEIKILENLDKEKPLIGSSQDPALAEFAMTW